MGARRSDRLEGYAVWVIEALPPGDPVRSVRDDLELDDLSRDERADLSELDGALLEAAIAGDVVDELLDDDSTQPLQRWWWHLGAIRSGTYPLDLLPEHLRAVYRAAADQAS